MPQPAITLTAGAVTLELDPDLYWADEHSFAQIEQAVERSLTGKVIIYQGVKTAGRPITLQPSDNAAAWMPRATLTQLRAWEADPGLTLQLNLRGTTFPVIFRRFDGAPIEADPVEFVADPLPGEIGDWYLATLRFLTV